MKKIKTYIDLKRERNQNYSPKEISREDFEEYKRILRCSDCESQPNSEIKYFHLPEIYDPKPLGEGYGGATLYKLFDTNTDAPVIIKKFYDQERIEKGINAGIEEVVYSLLALEMNTAPQKLKMVRIYDAILCPKDCLSIMMECAKGEDILASLKKAPAPEDVVKAVARYFATSHIQNNLYGFKSLKQQEENLNHTANFLHTLLENLLEDQGSSSFFSLHPGKEITDLQEITSRNIIRLLPIIEQRKFARLVRITCSLFKKNAEAIFGALKNKQPQNLYPLTIVFGDAHGRNFFYNATFENDSLYCISAIDFATIIRTLGVIADPAEDVGRFLGSIRNLEAEAQEIQQIDSLQDLFLVTYLQTIHESPIVTGKDFERIFKENVNFYKLRYYKPIFNSPNNRVKVETKKKLLQSWIKENAALESVPEKNIVRKKSNNRLLTEVDGDPYGYLPDRPEEFIESTAEEEDKRSYLTRLWDMLSTKGTATLSSKAAISGMGGVGKSTLALEYAHEALGNKAYNFIYWIQSSSEISLLKWYRNLLEERGIPTQGKEDQEIITLVKQEVPKMGKCLLIYDNVPDPALLNDKIPTNGNSHILITSRCNEGWEEKWGAPITLDVFSPENSIEYLLSVTGLEENDENKRIAGKLAEALQHLPLALAHAAHYIKLEGASHKAFENYLKGFQELSTAYFEEKKNSFTDPNSKLTYDHLIARTLRMTEQYLSRLDKKHVADLAKKLMNYCAYLDSDSLSEELFPEYEKKPEDVKEALQLLSSLSLLKNMQGQSVFSMHHLEQLVIQEKLKGKQQTQKVLESIVPRFNRLFEKYLSDEQKFNKVVSYLPHIHSLLEYGRQLEFFSEDVHDLAQIGALLSLVEIGNLTEGERYVILKQFEQDTQETIITPTKNIKSLKFFFNILGFLNNESSHWIEKIIELFKSNPKSQMLFSLFDKDSEDDSRKTPCDLESTQIIKKEFIQERTRSQFSLKLISRDEIRLQEHVKKIGEYKKYAKQGLAIAQYNLARTYYKSRGIEKNYNKAIKWYKKAVDQGYAKAQFGLGVIYWEQKNVTAAMTLWFQAAQQGFAKAQFKLGELQHILLKNYDKAIEWYKKAVDQGYAKAQTALGVIYLNKNDYEEAFKWLTLAADRGDRRAQYKLGLMYIDGQVEKNDEKEFKWLSRSAKQDLPEAQCALGVYWSGKDNNKALKWLSRATEQGNIEAQYLLGCLYMQAFQDSNKGLHYIILAAEKGLALAQFSVGSMYYNTQKYDDAVKWLTLAAEQGNKNAKLMLIKLYKKISNTMISKKDYFKVLNFYKYTKLAEQGEAYAQLKLGKVYLTGIRTAKNDVLVAKDYGKAFQYFSQAAIQEIPEAQLYLSILYAQGKGVAQDSKEATQWLTRSAEQGYAKAQFYLGVEFFEGLRIEKNLNIAIKYFKLAARQGYAEAQFQLGKVYTDDQENRNDAEAFKYFSMAAEHGHVDAHFNLGVMYINGHGVDRDDFEALHCFTKSAKQGNATAQSILKWLGILPEYLPNSKEKTEEELVLQAPQNTLESDNIYALQADAYTYAAVQHAEEGNTQLAIHLFEEADKKHQEAEDAQLAAKLQQEEFMRDKLQ